MADPVLGGYVDEAGVKRPVKGVAIISGYASDGSPLPSDFESWTTVFYRDTSGNITSMRKTNGTVTMVADAPVIAGETVAYLATFLNYISGSVASIPRWVKQ